MDGNKELTIRGIIILARVVRPPWHHEALGFRLDASNYDAQIEASMLGQEF